MKITFSALLIAFSFNIVCAIDFEWANRNGSASRDEGRSVTCDKSGNIIITGYFNQTVDFNPGVGIFNLSVNGDKDIFIQKLSSNGSFLWAKKMGSTFDDAPNQVKTDKNNNIYTVGHFEKTVDFDPGSASSFLSSAGAYDIFIQKLDSNGNYVWAKKIGSSDYDDAQAIEIDKDGNIYVSGYFSKTVDFNPGLGVFNLTSNGYQDAFLLKLDKNGNFMWVKQMGGTDYDLGYSICSDNSGNVYTTGAFGNAVDFDPGNGTFNLTSAGGSDLFVQKLSSQGNFIWAKRIGNAETDAGKSICLDNNQNICITGGFFGTVDFNPNAGVSNMTSAGNLDIFVLKLNSLGNLMWAKRMGGSENDYPNCIVNDKSNNLHLTGQFERTADFDPGPASFLLNSAGEKDIFFEKLTSNGDFISAYRIGNAKNEYSNSIVADIKGNIYLTGSFENIVDFNPFNPINNLTSAGTLDIFSLKIKDAALLVKDDEINNEESFNQSISKETIENEITIYPNPFNSELSLKFSNPEENVLTNVFDMNGSLIYSSNQKNNIQTDIWVKGMYVIEIQFENQNPIRKKIVKN